MQTKLGKNLVPGDVVVLENGQEVKIIAINPGMIKGQKLIEWAGGWGHVAPRDEVEVKEK